MYNGKRFAVSLTFDDGYLEHLTVVCPELDAKGMKGTFYVGMPSFLEHAKAWKLAHVNGHEIGNHTVFHPGPRNSSFAGERNYERMTEDDMAWEMDTANDIMETLLGERPKTFAYPHGCHHIGEGRTAGSYYPSVTRRFVGARGFNQPEPNHPERMNRHMLAGFPLDSVSEAQLKVMLDWCESDGLWLILHGHRISETGGAQSVNVSVFRWLLGEMAQRDCLVAPVAQILQICVLPHLPLPGSI